ncbi:hypothetical protein QGN32_23760 [Mycolicibacterium sp. ND9-15]|uniref:hypothetical protein n=1 Tax=Mycolicibacterium sp. ND9-15 TaxID=3042320 RepID=UPI002DD95673|nr:hypothetical protein [Mycolicibacterium sp. ND9-15]WSE56305.1 hypothetical protein QGN32_23760 [Mycolicibacterium sp. ND9-15]
MSVSLGDATYYDLGAYPRPIEPPSPQAQVWFDRGLVWSYAEAAIIGQQLALAAAGADVPIRAPCACRLEVSRAAATDP